MDLWLFENRLVTDDDDDDVDNEILFNKKNGSQVSDGELFRLKEKISVITFSEKMPSGFLRRNRTQLKRK